MKTDEDMNDEIRVGFIECADDEDDLQATDFAEFHVRKAFICKIYLILTLQHLLMLTFIIFGYIWYVPEDQYGNETYGENIETVLGIALFIVILIPTFVEFRNKIYHFLMFALYVLLLSAYLGIMTYKIRTNLLMVSVGLVAYVCFCNCIFALQTKYDFTLLNGIIFVVLIQLFIFMCMTISVIINKSAFDFNTIWIATLGALFYSMYIVYNITNIVNGTHKFHFNRFEYFFAVLMINVDPPRLLILIRYICRRQFIECLLGKKVYVNPV